MSRTSASGKEFRRVRGLSLIETVIAFTVFLMLTLFVMSLAPGSLLSLGRAHHQIVASNLALSVVEDQRALGFDALALEPGRDLTVYQLDDGVKFTPRLVIKDMNSIDASYAAARARVIRVTVRWDERSLKCETFRETVVAKVHR